MKVRALCLLATIAVAGCAEPAPEDDLASAADALGTSVLPVSGGYIAHVTAAGSGCPAGSWLALTSDDGQTFTLLFSAYEAKVGPGKALDVKQCLVNVALRDPAGRPLSFAVGSFSHMGYVLLDSPGMRAARSTSYTFGGGRGSGGPAASAPFQRREIEGPFEESYVQTDDVFSGVWSPCSAVSNLVINTSLVLHNDVRRMGSGYANTASVDGGLRLAFRVDWRRC